MTRQELQQKRIRLEREEFNDAKSDIFNLIIILMLITLFKS